MASFHMSVLAHAPRVWQAAAAGIAQAPSLGLLRVYWEHWEYPHREGAQQQPHCSDLHSRSGSASSCGAWALSLGAARAGC